MYLFLYDQVLILKSLIGFGYIGGPIRVRPSFEAIKSIYIYR